MNKDRTYRVIIWGTGSVGRLALREALARPELEVVGVRVYSESKDGVDIGELVGGDPVGISATRDVDALLALDADCVLHTPQPLDHEGMTAEVIRILASGKNVVSTASYHYPPGRGQDYSEQLESACQRGGVSLMGAGLHPSFATSNFVIPLTGAMRQIDHIRIVESDDIHRVISDMGGAASPFVSAIGFGQVPEQMDVHNHGAVVLDMYYDELACFLALRLFGAEADQVRVERQLTGIPAEEDYEVPGIPGFVIKKGTALTVLRSQQAYIGDRQFFSNEVIWYLTPENQYLGEGREPSKLSRGASNYYTEISGKPTTMKAEFTMDDDADAPPIVTSVCVATLIQSIVPICFAKPGLVYCESTPRFSPDLRDVIPASATTSA